MSDENKKKKKRPPLTRFPVRAAAKAALGVGGAVALGYGASELARLGAAHRYGQWWNSLHPAQRVALAGTAAAGAAGAGRFMMGTLLPLARDANLIEAAEEKRRKTDSEKVAHVCDIYLLALRGA